MSELIMKPLSYFTNRLKDKPFSFVRYQDGDVNCVNGRGRYTRSHSLFKDMSAEALRTITNPHLADNYIYGTCVPKTIARRNPNIDWFFSDIFTINLSFGNLFPMIQEIRKKKVIVVGSEYIKPIKDKAFPYAHFVEVPYRNCWTNQKRIESEIRKAISDGCLISFSAGTMTNILIHRLYPEFGNKCFMIDFGCIWDFLCNHIIRRDWKMRIEKDSTWVSRVIAHALGKDKVGGPLPNPVSLGDDINLINKVIDR